ncbi:hypothetical protein LTR95_011459 [Oleoguttula sp. CCFEE 5521]
MAGVYGTAADAARLPQTPRRLRQEHSEPLHRLVVHIRDALKVEIDPRDHTYVPSGSLHRHDEKLYKCIQLMFWRCPRQNSNEVPEQLREEISRFEDDCKTSHLRDLSPRERAKALRDRLFDVSWMTAQAITPTPVKSPLRKVSPPRTSPRSGPFPSRMPGPSREPEKDEPITFSLSPAVLRSTARTVSSTSLTTVAATSAATSFSPGSDALFKSAHTSFTSYIPADTSMHRVDSHDTVADIPSSLGWTQDTLDAVNALTDSFNQPTDERPAKRRCSSDEDFVLVEEAQHISPKAPTPKPYDTRHRRSRRVSTEDSDGTRSGAVFEQNAVPVVPAVATSATPSPQKKTATHYQVSRFPQSGFGFDFESAIDSDALFPLIVERARLSQHLGLGANRVSHIRTALDAKGLLDACPEPRSSVFYNSHPLAWTADAPDLTFSGTLELSTRTSEPLFKTVLHPLRVEQSCRVQRHFGWGRFFYVTLPSLNRRLPQHLKDQSEMLRQAVLDWMLTPKEFLGRSWQAFHIQEVKAKRHGNRPDDGKKAYRVIFFATHGVGVRDPLSLEKFLDWMVPLTVNVRQPACKAFKRLDLMVSSTWLTINFLPRQIRLGVDDVYANGMHEDHRFDDTSRKFGVLMVHDQREVMTDGCARISVGAAKLVCESLKLTHWPTAFQARINGAKGMWYISAPYETTSPEDLEVWIEIRKSQLKVQVRDEDKHVATCEPDRWSFDVVSWSKPLQTSEIHRDFMQILEDRGVPRGILKDLVQDGLDLCTAELASIIHDPVALTLWRHKFFARQELASVNKLQERGLPVETSLRTQVLVDQAGYMPPECPMLAKAITYMVETNLQDIRSHIEAPCSSSTIVVGIADHTGQLEPGEVHLALSQPLSHGEGAVCSKEVLVARHPTLRGSDMQRVRCVYKPGLAHLKDVIVMSTKGRVPLASKLQGGDYDGDKFWVCADPRLVEPFRNAQILKQDGIEEFGIAQDVTTLSDLAVDGVGSAAHTQAWLNKAFEFSLKPNMLGTITNHFYKLSYAEQTLWSPAVGAILDLHDTIIDAAKNGYTFNHGAFNSYLKSKGFPTYGELPPPRFQHNIESVNPNPEIDFTPATLLEAVKPPKSRITRRHVMHILDDVLFYVINPAIERAVVQLKSSLAPVDTPDSDADLEYPLCQLKTLPPTCLAGLKIDLQLERKLLLEALDIVNRQHWQPTWARKRASPPSTAAEHTAALATCFAAYDAIDPSSSSGFWHLCNAPKAPSNWKCFKVAVLAGQGQKRRRFMMQMAKDVVIYLKSFSESGRRVLELVASVKKPKRPKGWVAGLREANGSGDAEVEAGSHEEDDPEAWNDGSSVFEGLDEVM